MRVVANANATARRRSKQITVGVAREMANEDTVQAMREQAAWLTNARTLGTDNRIVAARYFLCAASDQSSFRL
jgi:hypothetical protein